MGFWDETCGITGLPILWGDECIMVVATKEFSDKHNIQLCSCFAREIENIAEGIYDGYGWLEDYPGIEEDDYDNRPDLRSMFFLKEAWNLMLDDDEIKKDIDGHMEFSKAWENQPLFDKSQLLYSVKKLKEFIRIYYKCFYLRIDIFAGIQFKGIVSIINKYKCINVLNEFKINKLNQMIQNYNENA